MSGPRSEDRTDAAEWLRLSESGCRRRPLIRRKLRRRDAGGGFALQGAGRGGRARAEGGRTVALFRSLLVALFAATLAGTAVAAEEERTASEQLEAAKGLYQEGHFGEAIVKLQALLDRIPELRDVALRRSALADAHLHLALSYLALDLRDNAKAALRGMLEADPQRSLSPDVYAPKVTALLAEARAEIVAPPSAAPSPAPVRRKSRTPLLLGGAAVAAGGGVALATRGGGEGSGQGFPETPATGNARIEWLGATPAPGSSVPLRLGGCPRGLTAACTNSLNMVFSVTSDVDRSDVFLKVQLLNGSLPCLEGWSSDTAFSARSLRAGVAEQMVINPLIAWTSCSAPYSTTSVTALLYTRGTAQLLATRTFGGAYRFTP
jgi:hypothetical protein